MNRRRNYSFTTPSTHSHSRHRHPSFSSLKPKERDKELNSTETSALIAVTEDLIKTKKALELQVNSLTNLNEQLKEKEKQHCAKSLQIHRNLLGSIKLISDEKEAVKKLLDEMKINNVRELKHVKQDNQSNKETLEKYLEAINIQKTSIVSLQTEKNELIHILREQKRVTLKVMREMKKQLRSLQEEITRKNEALCRKTRVGRSHASLEAKLKDTRNKIEKLEKENKKEKERANKFFTQCQSLKLDLNQTKVSLLSLTPRKSKPSKNTTLNRSLRSTGRKNTSEHTPISIYPKQEKTEDLFKAFQNYKTANPTVRALSVSSRTEQDELKRLRLDNEDLRNKVNLLETELTLEQDIRQTPSGSALEANEVSLVLKENESLKNEVKFLKKKNLKAFEMINQKLRKQIVTFINKV